MAAIGIKIIIKIKITTKIKPTIRISLFVLDKLGGIVGFQIIVVIFKSDDGGVVTADSLPVRRGRG